MNDQIPNIGFGTWKLKNEPQSSEIIRQALAAGYRLFDTASAYENEEAIGAGLQGFDREALCISGKLWNADREHVLDACRRSLARLRVDYLDLYLIHWPVPGCFTRTWDELIRLREEGLIRSIGVSNFERLHLDQLASVSSVLPVVNQFETHPLWKHEKLVDYCQQKGIAVQAYAPLAQGSYQDRPILTQIGKTYGKSAVQVGLRWLVQRGISVIPRSVRPERIAENAGIFDFKLTEAEMQAIDQMDEHFRSVIVPDDIVVKDWEL